MAAVSRVVMRSWTARVYRVILGGVRLATAVALVMLVVVVTAAVIVRYFGLFGGSLHWASELSRFTIIWVVMLGSVIAFDRGAHVAIGLFQESLPPLLRRVVQALAYTLSLVFLATLAWTGYALAFATMRQLSPALGLPIGYVYLAIPVGATLMTAQAVLFALAPELRASDGAAPDERR